MNPYTVLNLKPSATLAQIKRAFRRLSRKGRTAHPDMGGDREAFAELLLAYQVLSDSRRRAQYDTTGSTDQIIDRDYDNAVQVISATLGEVMQLFFGNYLDPTRSDIIAKMREVLRKKNTEYGKQMQDQRKAIETLKTMSGRFVEKALKDDKPHTQPNLMEEILLAHIASVERATTLLEETQKRNRRALELLDGFEFKFTSWEEWAAKTKPKQTDKVLMVTLRGVTTS